MTSTDEDFASKLTGYKPKAAYAIWKQLADGRIGPRRDAITPSRLRATTAYCFVIDVTDNDFRFRFAGDRIIQFMDRRLIGEMLSAHLENPYFAGMNRFFARCVQTKAPLVNGPSRSSYPGKEHLEIEVMVLPLSDDGVHVNGILGTFDTWQLGTHTSA